MEYVNMANEDLNRLTLALEKKRKEAELYETCMTEMNQFLGGKVLIYTRHLLSFSEDYCHPVVPYREHFETAHQNEGIAHLGYRVACEKCVDLLKQARDGYIACRDDCYSTITELNKEHAAIAHDLFKSDHVTTVFEETRESHIDICKLDYGKCCELNNSLYIKVQKHKKYQNYDLTWTKGHCILMNLKLGTLRAVRYNTKVVPKRLICEVYPTYSFYEDAFLKD